MMENRPQQQSRTLFNESHAVPQKPNRQPDDSPQLDRNSTASQAKLKSRSRKLQKKQEAADRSVSHTRVATKHEDALPLVRNMILSGELNDLKDKQLFESNIEVRLKAKGVSGVGHVAIRRALIELKHEGIVEIHPKSGTFIHTISGPELGQLVRTRSVLEELFVCTIARDSSPLVYDRLEPARDANEQIKLLANLADHGHDPQQLFTDSLFYDMRFHDQLAEVAGYKDLTQLLRSVRYRLRLAQKNTLSINSQTLREIAADHDAILAAIRPQDTLWSGDVVKARLAIKSHLRNAIERLGSNIDITASDQYTSDPLMDLPAAVSPADIKHTFSFGILRLLLELVVAAELSRQNLNNRLLVPTRICKAMNDMAKQCYGISRSDDKANEKAVAMFVNLDIQFHASLAYISGLIFAQEAITHIWQRMYEDAQLNLDCEQMTNVVAEHNLILRDINFYSDNKDASDGTAKVLRQILNHFLESRTRFVKNDAKLRGIAIDDLKEAAMPTRVRVFVEWFIDQLSVTSDIGSAANQGAIPGGVGLESSRD